MFIDSYGKEQYISLTAGEGSNYSGTNSNLNYTPQPLENILATPELFGIDLNNTDIQNPGIGA